jgi:hypothetical protein
MLRGKNLSWWHWPLTLKIKGFPTLLRTMYVPSLVKIHWRMLILECSQGCCAVKNWPRDLDLWAMTLKIKRANLIRKSNKKNQTNTKLKLTIISELIDWYWQLIIPSSTKLRRDIVTLLSVRPSVRHVLVNTLGSTSFNGFLPNLWRMLILECSQGCYAVKIWPGDLELWHMTLKIYRFQDSLKDFLTHCKYTLDVFADPYMYSPSVVQRLFHSDWFRGTRHQLFYFGQNPLKDVDPRVFTRMWRTNGR